MHVLAREDLPTLFEALRNEGREIIGPTVRDGAIVYDEIDGTGQLPRGWTDRQAPGSYRLERREDDAYFGFAAGPDSWKKWLFPPRETLYRARRRDDGKIGFDPVMPETTPRAFVGVRACELAAMRVQDRTYLDGPHVEPRYRARREAALVVAVNCTEAGDLCFCTSTDTGPEVGEGADLVLTELPDRFVVEARSERGEGVLDRLPTEHAGPDDRREVEEGIDHAARNMGRSMDTNNLPGILFGNLDHPRWNDVAERCLSCGNCTNVCPTCFCATCESSSSIDGTESARTRSWDSCFTPEHGEIHGHDVRPTILDRYRQWLTHKVGSWVSQFGTSGCVGCGRCIAWCPVGIDLTQEVAAIRADAEPAVSMPERPHHTPRDAETQVPRPATVTAVTRETHDTVTLHVEDTGGPSPEPGQFHMLSLPGVG
ncbi:MAG: 4Fe-4S dicluster domain-containing protein, partial [Polyangiales bacterium]